MAAAPHLEAAEPESWEQANARYLGASVAWLRLQLRKLVPPAVAPAPPPPTDVASKPEDSGTWLRRLAGERVPRARDSDASALLALPSPTLEDELRQATQERLAAARCEPPPALLLLAERFGLSQFERDILLLCAAVELDPSLAALCAQVQGAQRNYPTFALALQALDEPSWEALAAHRPLRYTRMIEVNQPGATALTAAALRADERIVNYLKGLNILDERLTTLLTQVREPILLADSQRGAIDEALQRLRAEADGIAVPALQLIGRDAASRVAVAANVSAAFQRRLYRLSIDALPTGKADVETLARLWQRESLLLPVALYIEADSLEATSATELVSALTHFLERDCGLVFVGVREACVRLGTANILVSVPLPSAAELHTRWHAALVSADMPEPEAADAAQQLAGHFQINFGELEHSIRIAAERGEALPVSAVRVWQECRDLSLVRLDSLAQRLVPKATWEQLVVNQEAQQQLRQIVAQFRNRHIVYERWGFAQRMNRGLGINALFTGESGTGKTMAAEVIANELCLHLYRIDLSAVVSKYIGETEKNLRKLFDAAESGGAILFFDEADALFGKRSEVKDSHDRYANIEINYLLQRMEAFSGLAILATNMKSALDAAFMRRLRFVVQFIYPGTVERKQLWQKALPPELPCEPIDYDRLARFGLSGGNIHSIALNAAFIAAESHTALSMSHLLAATRTELRKLEKPVNEAEFR